jgi:hypothetical protein
MRSHAIPVIALTVMLGVGLLAQQTPQPQPTVAAQPTQAVRRPASPAGTAATQVGGQWAKPTPDAAARYAGGKWIEVTYGRPILRGRTDIFGTGAEYGKKVSEGSTVWRAGANVTTRLMTEVPLVFDGKTLPAGEYSVFVDLKPGAWTLIFSKQPFQQKYDPANKTETWGSYNYDPAQDVLRVPMKVAATTTSMDQFTISFVDMIPTGGKLAMSWEKTTAAAAFTVGS